MRLLSQLTAFCGPLVAQTVVTRLAQPCGADAVSSRKYLQMRLLSRARRRGVVAPDSACHAAGRGFESRRSRLWTCLQMACFVVHIGGLTGNNRAADPTAFTAANFSVEATRIDPNRRSRTRFERARSGALDPNSCSGITEHDVVLRVVPD